MGFNPKYLIMLGLLFVLMIIYYFYFEHRKSQQLIEKQSKRITQLEEKVTDLIKKPPVPAETKKADPKTKSTAKQAAKTIKPINTQETSIYEVLPSTDQKPINLKYEQIGKTEAAEIEAALNANNININIGTVDGDAPQELPNAHHISDSQLNIFDVDPSLDDAASPVPMVPLKPAKEKDVLNATELSQLDKLQGTGKMTVNAAAVKKLNANSKKKI
jgi:hypothetical protein